MQTGPLAVTMGDPAGCGPQITAAAWRQLRHKREAAFAVLADPNIFEDLCPIDVICDVANASDRFSNALPVLAISNRLSAAAQPGRPDPAFAPAIIESIEQATSLALAGQVSGVVTNPISKAILYEAGFEHPGHTEFIARLCADATGEPITPVMMLIGGGLRVALATIHIPLMAVASALTVNALVSTAQITADALRRDFGIATPRIAFTGLNPHAGENGAIGREEIDIINPAAEHLRSKGLSVSNARSADTVFHEALSGQFDAVIAMTHDQGLIPVKTLDMWGGVNTTLGLPIMRTSPDHGTAYQAASAGTCKPDSLLAAIDLALRMAHHRRGAHV